MHVAYPVFCEEVSDVPHVHLHTYVAALAIGLVAELVYEVLRACQSLVRPSYGTESECKLGW